MMTATKIGQSGSALALLFLLGACVGGDTPDLEIACPSAQIAVPSDQIGHSDSEGRIRYVAKIEQLVSDCTVDDDKIAVDLTFNVRAERGPVFEGRPISLTYFIATVDPNREIIDKQLLDVLFELALEQAESVSREELTLHLPLPKDYAGANYNLYLGFQPEGL